MDKAIIEGYIAVTDTLSRKQIAVPPIGIEMYEVIAPGAFERAINESGALQLLLDHNRIVSDELTLKEDPIGLYFTAAVSDVDILVDALMGRIRGCSFGFERVDHEIIRYGGVMCNRLKRFRLKEVSLSKTTHPLHRSAITHIEILDHELEQKVQQRIKELKEQGEEISKYYM